MERMGSHLDYVSQFPLFNMFPIISLNDLSNAPHNILFKLFASKKKASIDATKKGDPDTDGSWRIMIVDDKLKFGQ
ncbi:MAG: hypothetical protein HQK75_20860, partial [Candidatus Magnetomorum sp.]|nr:hypothetical protein [Candidatus Magnetomorum sp.]